MNIKKQIHNIDVAVRIRPLNEQERMIDEEQAWEIKKADSHQLSQIHRGVRSSFNNIGDTVRSFEVVGEGQGHILQLKNKYRFGLEDIPQGLEPEPNRRRQYSQLPSRRQPPNGAAYATFTHRGSKSQIKDRSSNKKVTSSTAQKNNALQTPTPKQDFHGNHGTSSQKQINLYSQKQNKISEFKVEPIKPHLKEPTRLETLSRNPPGTARLNSANTGGNTIQQFRSFRQKSYDTKSNIPKINKSLTAKKQFPRQSKSKDACYFTPFKQPNLNSNYKSKPQLNRYNDLSHLKRREDKLAGTEKQNGNQSKNISQLQNKFLFDLVYSQKNSNRDLYEQTCRKIVLQALEGINGTLFVYGQTGTGKTFTMMGNKASQTVRQSRQSLDLSQNGLLQYQDESKSLYDTYENSGVLVLAMQDLFDQVNDIRSRQTTEANSKNFDIKLSYVEIYNELVYDLLSYDRKTLDSNVLSVHEAKNKEFVIKGANEIEVSSIQEVLQLIQRGERNRHFAETFLNHCSSRSHTLFRLQLVQYQKSNNQTNNSTYIQTKSYLNFVDLAGSERISNYARSDPRKFQNLNQTIRLKEGLSINKSLFYLTQVIHLISQKSSRHIPYRNSTLTKILKSSLSGNARTSIVICVTPATSQIDPTLDSLKFGQTAMKVQQSAKAQINQIKGNALKIRQSQNFKSIKNDAIVKDLVQDYEQKISALQNQIQCNDQISQLTDQVNILQVERDRLCQAVEHLGNRSFFTKQLYVKQKLGQSTITLHRAGDIFIQTENLASESIEQQLQERDQKMHELQMIEQSCRQTVNQIANDNKTLREDNQELKEECDRLESSYQEIIEQFTKMNQMHNEVIQMTQSKNKPESDIQQVIKMSDREIQRYENKLKEQLFKIKEEK